MIRPHTHPIPHSLPSRPGQKTRTANSLFPGLRLSQAIDLSALPLIQRNLCPETALDDWVAGNRGPALPPLTKSIALDFQIYAFLSIIVEEFIAKWYTNITVDRAFLDEIVTLLSHVATSVAERAGRVDWVAVFLDELMGIFEEHIRAYRIADELARNSSNPALVRQTVYHSIFHEPFLLPFAEVEADRSEQAWRHILVDRVLNLALPEEDAENECLKSLVTEICSELVLRNGLARAHKGFVIWQAIISALRPVEGVVAESVPTPRRLQLRGKSQANPTKETSRRRPRQRHDRKRSESSETPSPEVSFRPATRKQPQLLASVAAVLAGLWMVAYSVAMVAYSFLVGSVAVPFLPRRSSLHNSPAVAPILSMRVFSLLQTMLFLDRRLPWLVGWFSLARWFLLNKLTIGCSNQFLDRLLVYQINKTTLNAATFTNALRSIRAIVFPNNMPGPPRPPDPPAEEQLKIKQECARLIAEAIPAFLRQRILISQPASATGDNTPTEQELISVTEEISQNLGCLDDENLNKHLVLSITELLVAHLFPELKDPE